MLSQTVLTFGWPRAQPSQISAHRFLDVLKDGNIKTLVSWIETVIPNDGVLRICELDGLFRRGPRGMQAMRDLIGLVGENYQAWSDVSALQFECDAFAYAFLKQAHNYDVILPVVEHPVGPFRRELTRLKATLNALADFERSGIELPPGVNETEEEYLRVRAALSRPSARLERVILATLLINGPSTLPELSAETGTDAPTLMRILLSFSDPEYIAYEPDTERFRLAMKHLPSILFCLREKMGFDYLSVFE